MRRFLDRAHSPLRYLIHRLPRPLWREWQRRRLLRLVLHATHAVPLWRAKFSQHRLDPRRIQRLEDLALLPVTDKSLYLDRPIEEYIDGTRLQRGLWYKTSGTSGMPFSFLMSDPATADSIDNVSSLRFLWWRGVSLVKIPSIKMARIKIRAPETPMRSFIPVEAFRTDPRTTLEALARFDPAILSSYPSLLFEMAQLIEREPHRARPHPRFLLSFGEKLDRSVRDYIARVFEAEVYDRYGLEEIGAVGVECGRHDGFHINVESVIIEILDEDGDPVEAGTQGRIVATDLLNMNMPFIRYDTGDRGRMELSRCGCGLSTPRLFVSGRYSTSLSFGGRLIHHLEFDGALDSFMNVIHRYQVVKRSETEVLVRIIAGPAYRDDMSADIIASLAALVGTTAHVELQKVSDIPTTERGKSRILVDESH